MIPFWGMVFYCVLWVVFQSALYVVLYYQYIISRKASYGSSFRNSKILCYLFGALAAVVVCLFIRTDYFAGIGGLRFWTGFLPTMFTIPAGIVALSAVYGVELWIGYMFSRKEKAAAGMDEPEGKFQLKFIKEQTPISDLVLSMLLAPVFEELCFRGLLYERIRMVVSQPIAILIVAVVFGLIHIKPRRMPAAFVTSLVLSVCYVYGDIVAAVVCHIYYNVLSNLYITWKRREGRKDEAV